jgi:dihydrofolate synthase/folylpolyglutamate synthase
VIKRQPEPEGIRNLDQAFALFESRTNLERGLPLDDPDRVYRLDRMRELCAAFEDPQDALRVVHIAGSKGKGSTAACIAALLTAAGRKVGVYTSPHLTDYRERFTVYGEAFPEQTALEVARRLIEPLKRLEEELPGEGDATTFELLTLFGFLLFREAGCDSPGNRPGRKT